MKKPSRSSPPLILLLGVPCALLFGGAALLLLDDQPVQTKQRKTAPERGTTAPATREASHQPRGSTAAGSTAAQTPHTERSRLEAGFEDEPTPEEEEQHLEEWKKREHELLEAERKMFAEQKD